MSFLLALAALWCFVVARETERRSKWTSIV
jgi:hypothetical protein